MEKEFIVYITETLQKKVIVKAENEVEAITKAQDQYFIEEIVLDESDYLTTEFTAREKN